jgi:1-acylglycerone phosphate reductase
MAPRSVLITGCSAGGIGDALAQSFNRYGLRVFATARDLSKVEHLKKMGIETIQLDVVDPASVEKAAESVLATTGGTLDILVNNAGGGKQHLFNPHLAKDGSS